MYIHAYVPSFGRRNSAKHLFNPDSAELVNQHAVEVRQNHIITDDLFLTESYTTCIKTDEGVPIWSCPSTHTGSSHALETY